MLVLLEIQSKLKVRLKGLDKLFTISLLLNPQK